MRSCCFIGHRKILYSAELKQKLLDAIEDLILNKGVRVFIFGGKGAFDSLCYEVVMTLKEKYNHIKTYLYMCGRQFAYREEERGDYERHKDVLKDFNVKIFDEIFSFEDVEKSCKGKYIVRNKKMINNSDYCVFYYNCQYQPKKKVKNIYDIPKEQSKSGTKIAYEYALLKNKEIINLI